ncbi:GNAT family N-acetyltransferase [Nocardia sp. CDC159]|uniref:GNAT family N-acetyltransferase n=1 Tax=Nocardia pulmonis TaxID=2951408 RepID=A0A9X2E6W2_9NOCA|nr:MULTISPECIES: GNAT family N-acetyltransferase [Nocardia]MCM6774258.1 GNAT family N-acetyltransferase [Nocardia pulmonis]MCM6787145.1 GNAT family N-acetyltransferase [Nocardia sp. CDC159]
MRIVVDEVTGAELIDLLSSHLAEMHEHSPEDSVHALDLDALRKPDVTVWSVWDGDTLAGCGALKELDPTHGEIKSMRTVPAFQRRGVGALVLNHLIGEARTRGYTRLSLETGTPEFFSPARRLYTRHGFQPCPPFADYTEDPYSVFMTLPL